MIKKVDLDFTHKEVFASPTPLGLIGLAVSCAALMPIALGYTLTPAAFKTTAVWALFFGCGCQMITGLMEFANKNLFGGTIFTAFSFSWAYLAWSFYSFGASGFLPDHTVALSVDMLLFVIFSVLTYGFGFFSKLLFAFLLDIDLLYLCKIVNGLTGTQALAFPIALLTAGMGLIALWLAFAALINPTSGRSIFKVPGPMFFAPKKASFDFSVRYNIFEALYKHWQKNAYQEMELKTLQAIVKEKTGTDDIVPNLFYLQEYGCMVLTFDVFEKDKIHSLRLNAQGLDLYEQLILKKYSWK
ncbi:MAG TPA: GPR1/FUN34/YaaH family transporter [Candidatus Wallbacteria bacterium]|nr:GPR1/FUN34/YaaH family transporter [Candidatus Wallbacteria bacterium]